MTKIIYIFFIAFCPLLLSAQIILESATIPKVGDSLTYDLFVDYQDTVSFKISGENQTWEFSDFNITSSATETYAPIEGSNLATQFPNANIIVNQGFLQGAGIRSDEELKLIGLDQGLDIGFPIDATPSLSNEIVLRKTPLTYGDSFEDSANVTFTLGSDMIPFADSLAAFLPAGSALDSLRINLTITKTEEVIGWGTVKIEDQEWEALQVKQDDGLAIELELGLNLFGFIVWFPVSEFIEIGDVGDFGGQNSTTYKFVTNGMKNTLIEFTESEGEGFGAPGLEAPTIIGRLSSEVDIVLSSASNNSNDDLVITTYPNPISDVLHLEVDDEVSGLKTISVFDIKGTLVLQSSFYENNFSLRTRDIKSGSYILLLSVGDHVIKRKVIKQ